MKIKEEYRWIEGYEGRYKISNYGNCLTFVKKGTSQNTDIGRPLRQVKCTNGYIEYQLFKDGKRKCYMAHRLVAKAFIPNPENKKEVNHKDECVSNNFVGNLEWVTPKENCNYGTRNIRSVKNHNYPKVVKLTLNNEYIKTYDNGVEAARDMGIKYSKYIMKCCKCERCEYKGYKWMYEKDYLNMITLGEVV